MSSAVQSELGQPVRQPSVRPAGPLRRLAAEPLVHFLALGAVLFGVFGWLNAGSPATAAGEIVIDDAQLAALSSQFERVWQRPPTASELDGLLESWVREEILYREGVALGLDQDDAVIRRRVAQKMAFISEGMVDDTPTTTELEAWLDEHAATYRIQPRLSLRQIYFSPERHGDELDAVVGRALVALRQGDEQGQGDATLLPGTLEGATSSMMERTFGSEFAAAVEALAEQAVGVWRGPVTSGYGVHLVRIDAYEPGRAARLDDVRAAVERDLLHERTTAANEQMYQALRARYKVTDLTRAGGEEDSSGRVIAE